ncbi:MULTISPECIES: carbohydrate ABC transporter permease [unclassified Mesorhizobium]|uniref:carbohydrate ABC transporter permease n=1 Tax=unclassified Mesorhizobium TaxID=325217 RepID=UPI00112CAE25|nr:MULTISPECIES: sugar ABC transporter permease [unclassified Mesorhizobium]MBZ9809091.1 sugar ABC transporter permease [Mesorhizobium sp. ESP-6-2]TPM32148.1 sugar ABC transporter permease [Mesorhizobium sp. B2-2-2]
MIDRRHKSSLKRTQQRMALLFILPALAVYALFVLYPLAMSLWGSFFIWKGLRITDFAGLSNFSRLFVFPSSARLYGALWHNTAWFFGIMVFQNGIGLLFAWLLFLRDRGAAFFQSVFFFPAVLSPVIVGALWRLLLAPGGVVEWALNGLGLHQGSLTVLGNSHTALAMLVAVDAWNWMGLPVLIYTAGLRQISGQIFEAAKLDGAGNARMLFSVALPLLMPALGTLTTLSFINTFNQFDIVYVMQGVQGNPSYSTDTLVTYFYRLAFGAEGAVGITDIGLALALGTMLFLILSVGTLLMLRFFDRRAVQL